MYGTPLKGIKTIATYVRRVHDIVNAYKSNIKINTFTADSKPIQWMYTTEVAFRTLLSVWSESTVYSRQLATKGTNYKNKEF